VLKQIKRFFWIALSFPLFLSCLSKPAEKPHTDPLTVHFLNMGYADSVLIQFPNDRNLLIDAGDKENALKFKTYLSSLGIRRIDNLIITHPHKNHFGALLGLTETIPIRAIYENGDSRWEEGYYDLRREWENKKIKIKTLKRGDAFPHISNQTQIEILNPDHLTENTNDSSIIIKLTYGKTVFLFCGDLSEAAQEKLIQVLGQKLKADCVLVPHHGGPLSKSFINFFDSKTIFVISTGPNRWGVPRAGDLESLKGTVLRTDKQGNITLKSDGKKIKISTN
jgi:competence protein ComEC